MRSLELTHIQSSLADCLSAMQPPIESITDESEKPRGFVNIEEKEILAGYQVDVRRGNND